MALAKMVAITTVGTSLLTNTNKELKDKPAKLSEIADREIDFFIRRMMKEGTEPGLSAEINATLQLDAYFRGKRGKPIDIIHLILSDTQEMEKIKPFLESYFKKKGFEVAADVISGLKYVESRFKMDGLRRLIGRLAAIIEGYKGKQFDVIMNATGGFKAEIAYATVLSQLQHIESFYIYETFNEIVPMPHLPLSLDVPFWLPYKERFEAFERGVPEKEADRLLNLAPSGLRFLLEKDEENGALRLNAAGETFYLSFLEAEKQYLENLDQSRVFKKAGETTLWHKARSVNVTTVNDIPDREVKDLLERVIRFSFVKKVELEKFHEVGRSQGETCLHYKSQSDISATHYVQYEIRCKEGKQVINIIVEPGHCETLIRMLGKKAYP